MIFFQRIFQNRNLALLLRNNPSDALITAVATVCIACDGEAADRARLVISEALGRFVDAQVKGEYAHDQARDAARDSADSHGQRR